MFLSFPMRTNLNVLLEVPKDIQVRDPKRTKNQESADLLHEISFQFEMR